MEPQYEFESLEDQIEFEREKALIEQAKADGRVRNKLTLFVGGFVVVMPLLSYACQCGAILMGKEVPKGNILLDVTCVVGMLSILALQFPAVMPLLRELLDHIKKEPKK